MRAFLGAAATRRSFGQDARSFADDEGGVVAVVFAITFSAIFLMLAVAVDYGRTEAELVRVQNAVELCGARRFAQARTA